jgi:murein L,D-transpeptidase YafK
MRTALTGLIVLAGMWFLGGCGPSAPTGVRGGTYSGNCAQPMSATIADRIVVDKSDRKMYLYKNGTVIKTFRVSLGANDYQGPKVKRGDKRTPIGTYRILNKRCHPIKYMAMTISYPNAADIARAKKMGVDPGSLITIHGQPHWNADGHGDAYTLSKDWTDGCIALTNSDMRTLWSMIKVGTPITLRQ